MSQTKLLHLSVLEPSESLEGDWIDGLLFNIERDSGLDGIRVSVSGAEREIEEDEPEAGNEAGPENEDEEGGDEGRGGDGVGGGSGDESDEN